MVAHSWYTDRSGLLREYDDGGYAGSTTDNDEAKLLLPGLASFHQWVNPISRPIVRVAVSFSLFMHGWPKLPLGTARCAERLAQLRLSHSELFAWADILIEFAEGKGIMLGLFTRS